MIDTVIIRLSIWTAAALLALMVSGWMLWRDEERWRRGGGRGSGVTWVHRARFGGSLLMFFAWVAFAVVGVLGFYPTLSAYRSWGMLVGVLALAAYQCWTSYAWDRVERRATEEVPHG